ncbi:unnamed protein product, partial [Symbiodinium microadriaticum]
MAPPMFSRTSPRSPKGNPFSSPSPTPNPFMSFVAKGNNYWSKMSTGPTPAKDQKDRSASEVSSYTPPVSSAPAESLPAVSPEGCSIPCATPPIASASAADVPDPATKACVGAEGPPKSKETTDECTGHDSDATGDGDASAPQSPISPMAAVGTSALGGGVGNGEQEEECVLQLRAKLYRLSKRRAQSSNSAFPNLGGSSGSADEPSGELVATEMVAEWVEIGTGPVRVLRPSGTSAAGQPSRLVMRRESQAGGV